MSLFLFDSSFHRSLDTTQIITKTPKTSFEVFKQGADRIWTGGYWCCRPLPYHLATAPYDSKGIWTPVTAVKGRCLNRLTMEPHNKIYYNTLNYTLQVFSNLKSTYTFKTTYWKFFPSSHFSISFPAIWSCPRPISNSQLHALLHFHLCPIYLVVFKGVYYLWYGISHLEGGFTLRCLQRLSRPNLATRPWIWQSNRYTRGSSIPVLSY